MTTLAALHAAALADPAAVPPGVYLDCFEEDGSRADYVAACREFAAKCREKRRYKLVAARTDSLDGEPLEFGEARRAIASWREWLDENSGGAWLEVGRNGGFKHTTYFGQRWSRLLPSLWSLLSGSDRWRRRGGKIEVRARWRTGVLEPGQQPEAGVALTFRDGWVSRAEFRDWQSASALLPVILADQPFAEAGIRGQPEDVRGRPWRKKGRLIKAWLNRDDCGPAWDLVERLPTQHGSDKCFENSESTRARSALSRALRQWATQEIRSEIPSPPA